MFDFENNKTLETLDNVPPDFHVAYKPTVEVSQNEEGEDVENITGYDLDETNGLVKGLMGSKKALDKSRAEAKRARGKQVDLSALSEFGEDPEAIYEAINAKMDELRASGDTKVEEKLNALKADLNESHQRALKEVVGRADGLQSQLVETKSETALKSAIMGEKDIISPTVVETILKSEIGFSLEDGRVQTYIKDSSGNPRTSAVTGDQMTPAERIAEMKKQPEFAPMFKAPDRSGAQTSASQSVVSPATQAAENKTTRQKLADGLLARQKS